MNDAHTIQTTSDQLDDIKQTIVKQDKMLLENVNTLMQLPLFQ